MNAVDRGRAAATAFRSMHRGEMLVLPNAWDAMSARVFEETGCQAIATTSAGVAWSLGYPDGEQVPWSEFLGATRRIARVLSVPLTVDFESGFSATPAELAERIREIIDAGASGINLEDSRDHQEHTLLPLDSAVERVATVRAAAERAGVPIVINARTDSYLQPAGSRAVSPADVVQRCRAYLSAGADCVYPIGLADIQLIRQLTAELRAPVNIMGRPGAPTLPELRAAGVARVSTAVGLAVLSAGVLRDAVVKLKETGSYEHMASAFNYPQMQQLFAIATKRSLSMGNDGVQ
jgi:2-methylisocitrate lyase-like PEP mutase family enzyme